MTSIDIDLTLFVRSLGVLLAFQCITTSWQLPSLIGHKGIEPCNYLIRAFRRDHSPVLAFIKCPTIFWAGSSNHFLHTIPLIGGAVGLLIATGLGGDFQWLLFALGWFLWISVLHAAPNFFHFPWDLLLLESLFLAVFTPTITPDWKTGMVADWPFFLHLAYVLLLFRVMFGMGLSKFRHLDARTKDLTYVYHFLEWQPMATLMAQHLRALPMWFHKMSLVVLFIIECIMPWALFAPAPWSSIAAAFIIALQGVIMLSGNYGIFNVLTAVIALPVLGQDIYLQDIPASWMVKDWLLVAYMIISLPHLLFLNSWTSNAWTHAPTKLSSYGTMFAGFQKLCRLLKPFGIWHGYGIFVARGNFQKIVSIFQMRDSQGAWHDVETRYLTNHCNKRPKRFAPYHPRFDHHLYYVHLRESDIKVSCLIGTNPYYVHPVSVIDKVIEHLYRKNPMIEQLFQQIPVDSPKEIRIATYEYQLVSASYRRKTGQ